MIDERTLQRAANSVNNAETIDELCRVIAGLVTARTYTNYGVTKKAGVSIERERKEANHRAITLLDSLPDDAVLTNEQRAILASYTGEGGIGANEHEYYTPQPVAEGMWGLMQVYGSTVGNWLEPAAGTGVFNESKPAGSIMTAAEISPVSSRINRLLHPEDKVVTTPFERVAASTEDEIYDGCVGNVPFGNSRGEFANLDPAYAKEKNIGRYFILRLLDKLKPGAMACIIVPYGMTSGSTHKKLREQVSRKAEFLGAHRLPSGTFDENGTSTATDVWVLRKHPEGLAQRILDEKKTLLAAANVLWDTFILGKWFELDGKRFVHGEVLEGYRMTVRNDTITSGQIKEKLLHKFDSRIDWEMLNTLEPEQQLPVEGDRRLINDVWYKFSDGFWEIDKTPAKQDLDAARYGAGSYFELMAVFDESNPAALNALTWDQIQAVRMSFPEIIPETQKRALSFASVQPQGLRERVFRGSMIGGRIGVLQDWMAGNYPPEQIDELRQDIARMVAAQYDKYGHPGKGKADKVRGDGVADWLKFKAAIDADGKLSALLNGTLDVAPALAYNSADPVQVINHLFSQIDIIPISIEEFREHYTGEAPEDDNELLAILAQNASLAITPAGDIMPMDRATSGDISAANSALMGALGVETNEALKQNYLRQLEELKRKRKWTDVDDIDFSLNARWFDRSLILEYLREQGYDELQYVKDINVEDGTLVSEQGYRGSDGLFAGYRYGTVRSKDKETGKNKLVYKRVTKKDPFLPQLENFLNGNKPTGIFAAQYSARLREMEKEFNDWIRQHDEIQDLVQQYNDAFNAYIPYEQSDATLELKEISGKTIPFGYQNSEVRRLSEDGKGIMGFGTGLGKTTTALALEAFNFENGRSKRTAIVVPKAVYQNWYYEAVDFYSETALSQMLFVGLDVLRDDEENIRQVPVLDDNGKPKLNKHTGEPMYRNAVALSSSETIKTRMNQIPQSNYRTVIMTKEQYARIPMREETIRDHAYDVLYSQAEAGRVNLDGTKHRDANRISRVLAEASDTGTEKVEEYPYFEDMGFDNVIADEGHNYRNSASAGREATALAYLPVGSVAQSARDMAVKNAYLMSKNNGRGCVLLTATPLVNSPIDAFNMLSHVVDMKEWQRMGIFTPDDFVKVFGEIAPVMVQKLSGAVEEKNGLVGFKNLDGLRGIFHRWTTMKTAADVSNDVKIPELDEKTVEVPLSAEQAMYYEELRMRAEALSAKNDPIASAAAALVEIRDGKGELVDPDTDSVFSIIRDMDRICTDLDLYRRQMTFRFPAGREDAIRKLVAELPEELQYADDEEGDAGEEIKVPVEATITVTGDVCQLVVPETYEQEVLKRLSQFEIDAKELSHPVPPKYAALIENLKVGLVNGKQIIFSDEKSQHGKLRRIIAQELGIEESEIAILNATTVAEAGKKGKKPKRVKAPKPLPDEPTDAQLEAYQRQVALYDDYIASQNEMSLGGLESISADYNEGRCRVILCNKKAEVGINLHHGTTDIHHLTLPWTPASINQRNGRGARVGSSQDRVNVHYYCGKGSFDDFRLATLKRKKDWIHDLLTSDQSRMANADANDAVEMQLMLARDPEERARRNAKLMEEAKAAAQVAATRRAKIDLQNFIKAQHAAAGDMSLEQSKLETLQVHMTTFQDNLDAQKAKVTAFDEEIAALIANPDRDRWDVITKESQLKAVQDQVAYYTKELGDLNVQFGKQERKLKRLARAESEVKRLRPTIKNAIDNGVLDVDQGVLEHGNNYLITKDGRSLTVGDTFRFDLINLQASRNALARINSFDFDARSAAMESIYSAKEAAGEYRKANVPIDLLPAPETVTENEVDLRKWMQGGVSIINVASRLTESEFRGYLKDGVLRLKENNCLKLNSAGQYEVEMIAGLWSRHSDTIMYPDSSNDVLKTRVANWARSKEYEAKFAASEFMTALFGDNYMSRIAEYGEKGSETDIAAFVAAFTASYMETVTGKRLAGQGALQPIDYVFRSKLPNPDVDGFVIAGVKTIPVNYSNAPDFKRALEQQSDQIAAQAENNCKQGARELAQALFVEFKAILEGGIKDSVGRMNHVLGRGLLSEVYASRKVSQGELSAASVFMHNVFYADAVNIGFIKPDSVTVELLGNYAEHQDFTDALDDKIQEMQGKGEAEPLMIAARERAGLVSDEQVTASKAAIAGVAIERETVEEVRVESEIIIKRNTTAILAKFRGRTMFKYGPDECYGFQDPKGKSGRLFSTKDTLKSRFGAKYYNGDSSDDEFPGSWWVISTRYSLSDVMAVINGRD